MKVKKKIFVAIFILTISVAKGQESGERSSTEVKHEYSVYLTGGLSSLSYKLNHNGDKSGGIGGGAGLAYTYNVNPNFGVSGGIELSTFGGTASYKSLNEEYVGTDDNGDPVKYNYTIDGFEESQSLALFSVPVTAVYKTPVNPTMQFYAGGGFKFGFPVNAKSAIQAGKVTSSGYYDYEQVRYTELPAHGFFNGEKPGEKTSTIDAGFAAMLTLESGLRFIVGKNALYAGLYFDYSLNSIKKTNDKHPLNYNREITYESVLNSALADKLNPISVGIKVRFSLF